MKISERLLAWYATNARELPWRSDPQPYKVWISEIMLQQTQVDTVIPYFNRWLTAFPGIEALAEGSEQDILAVWEGLGYYSRARNIKKCADILMSQFKGKIPSDPVLLQKLPGIGHYTAGAIASIAFNQEAIALDGNIKRVYARLMDLALLVDSRDGKKALTDFAWVQLPAGNAGEFNQALMDLGATVCVPANPKCHICPLSECCQSFFNNTQQERPIKKIRQKIPHYTVTAAVIVRNGMLLIAKRPVDGLLGGLWEFPGGKLQPEDVDLQACLKREIREELGAQIIVGKPYGVYKHAYTHFKITLHAFLCSLSDGSHPEAIQPEQVLWVHPDSLGEFPMGKVDRQIASRIKELGFEPAR
ncbi:MAG: A/G-specific adenine glycosylase [Anaerolineaceae bacterium]|nr:A/G-specific adenine glycosylase [Anaerolineaceae bacterium]